MHLAHHKQVIHHPEYCGENLLFHISQFAVNLIPFFLHLSAIESHKNRLELNWGRVH